MDGVSDELGLPGGAEAAGLSHGDRDADEDLPADTGSSGFTEIEGEDVGCSVVTEEIVVEAGDGRDIDEMKSEGVGAQVEPMVEETTQDMEEAGGLDAARVLAVAEGQLTRWAGRGGLRRHG